MTPARQPQANENVLWQNFNALVNSLDISSEERASLFYWENEYRAPYTSPPAPDKPKFSSEDLLLLAHDEWKRREERKHLHNEQDWISGFINGFLTEPTWARKMVDKIRADAKHPSTKSGVKAMTAKKESTQSRGNTKKCYTVSIESFGSVLPLKRDNRTDTGKKHSSTKGGAR